MKYYKFKEDYIYDNDVNFQISVTLVVHYQNLLENYKRITEDKIVYSAGKGYEDYTKEYKRIKKETQMEINILNNIIAKIYNDPSETNKAKNYIIETE